MKVTNMLEDGADGDKTGNNAARVSRAPTATIEEVDEEGDEEESEDFSAPPTDKPGGRQCAESPLLGRGGGARPPNTLVRVSTYGSSLNQPAGASRHDSTRSRYRTGGLSSRKLRKRVIFKNGECNVFQSHISQRRLRYLQDIFTTLVDTQWRWTLLVFALSFILSWLGFAAIWWLISFTHGDLEPNHLPDEQNNNGWKPCVYNIYDFASCFLFSIETQHTIGYGSRGTTEECPEAIFIMCLQSITGVMIQAFMVGIVFAKMSRPKQRTQTLLFSRSAVICQRDGNLCLMFRVGDMRKSHIIGASVRAQLIKTRQTQEGEVLNQSQCELDIGTDYGNADLFFIWPMTVVHRITSDSPLYKTSANDLIEREKSDKFEFVVILEGTIESTGQTTQARSSYLPNEILWGHRFESMVSYNKDRQAYEVNYNKFNNTCMVDTPLCSAKDLEEFYRIQQELRQPVGTRTSETVSAPITLSPTSSILRYSPSTPEKIFKNIYQLVNTNSSEDGKTDKSLPSSSVVSFRNNFQNESEEQFINDKSKDVDVQSPLPPSSPLSKFQNMPITRNITDVGPKGTYKGVICNGDMSLPPSPYRPRSRISSTVSGNDYSSENASYKIYPDACDTTYPTSPLLSYHSSSPSTYRKVIFENIHRESNL